MTSSVVRAPRVRSQVRPLSRTFRLMIAVALALGCGFVLVLSSVVLMRGLPFALVATPTAAALELMGGATAMAVGLAMWVRQAPGGLTTAGLGVAWLVREWANPSAPSPWSFALGIVLGAAWVPLAGRLVLVHPLRRLSSSVDRILMTVVVAASFVPALVRAATWDPVAGGCAGCPPNPLSMANVPGLVSAGDRTGMWAGAAMSVALLVVAALGVGSSSPAVRLARLPVLVGGGVFLVSAGVLPALRSTTRANTAESAQLFDLLPSAALALLAIAVAWDVVRTRAVRRRAAELVARMSAAPRPGLLREELARLVHDDTLQVGYALDDGRFVDLEGHAVDWWPPPSDGMTRSRSTTMLERAGRPLAVLSHRPGLLDDRDYRETIVRTAALAIEHERLQAELRARLAELGRSRSALVASFDAERRRLERSLHDGAQQRAVALLLTLRLAQSRAEADARSALASAIAEAELAIAELRELAHGLYPASLAEEGLGAALQELAERITIPLRLDGVPSTRLPVPVETTAYRLIASAVDRGTESIAVRMASADGPDGGHRTRLTVEVSGHGPTTPGLRAAGGLVGLDDRVVAIGGTLVAHESPKGFQWRAVLPCES